MVTPVLLALQHFTEDARNDPPLIETENMIGRKYPFVSKTNVLIGSSAESNCQFCPCFQFSAPAALCAVRENLCRLQYDL